MSGEALRPARIIAAAIARLSASGVYNPAVEVDRIVEHVCEQTRHAGTPWWESAGRERFDRIVEERARRKPLSRIIGHERICGLRFRVRDGVFRPYPETERFVEALCVGASEWPVAARILDVGTGSGCILLALLAHLPEASGVGTDLDAAALALAGENAGNLGLGGRAQFFSHDWFAGIKERFDVVVSHPPAVARCEMARLSAEMRDYDPARALDGGRDGLDGFRSLAAGLDRVLKADGVGYFQAPMSSTSGVAGIFSRRGFRVDIKRDFCGLPVGIAVRPG